MKFVRFDYSAGFCGTDNYEFGKFEDEATDAEISDIAQQLCVDWCESYGVGEDDDEVDDGVEFEYDFSWKFVDESEVEPNNLTDYSKGS